MEAGDGDSEDLEESLESAVGHLAPPELQDRAVEVLDDPEEAVQEVPRRLLLHYDGSFGLQRNLNL